MATERRKGRLILFPVTLSQHSRPDEVLPEYNIELLREVSHFIVENVRTARRFIKRCHHDADISSMTFQVVNRDTPEALIPDMLRPALDGDDIGLMSEAGCPAVADPGANVVAEARRRGIEVVPLVGPSSILLGLMASGFNGQSFAFNGYLPIGDEERRARLNTLRNRIDHERQTQIFIETPYRNNTIVKALIDVLPSRMKLCVAVDLTSSTDCKVFNMTLGEWAKQKVDLPKTPAIFLLFS